VPYTLIPEFTAEESTFGSMLGAHVAAFPDLDGDGRDEVIMEGDNKVYLALSRL
jgi:hypothetical protein